VFFDLSLNAGVLGDKHMQPGFTLQGSTNLTQPSTLTQAPAPVQTANTAPTTFNPQLGGGNPSIVTNFAPKGDPQVLGLSNINNATPHTVSNDPNLYQQVMNAHLGNLDRQISDAQTGFDLNSNRVNNSYNSQLSGLQGQNDLGNANYDQSVKAYNQNKVNTLQDLQSQLRGMVNGYQNQLGTYGAGDSSAGNVLSYALSQQGNQQQNRMQDQFANQETGLNLQKKGLDLGYQTGLGQLNDYKANQLQQIMNNYGTQLGSLQGAKSDYLGQQAEYLKNYSSPAAQDALNHLVALDQQLQAQGSTLNKAYQQQNAPTTDLSPYVNYNVQPVSQAQLSGLNLGQNAVNYDPQYNPITLKKTNQAY
jgi:hypothetical protein